MKRMFSGTTWYDPSKTFNGYTLWSPITVYMQNADKPYQTPGEVNLVDMRGNIVHKWKTAFPTFYCYLLENGNLLCGLNSTETDGSRPGVPPYYMGGTQGYLHEYDWEGNLVFEHKDLTMHHDFKKLPNGNYMYLGWERVPAEMRKKVRGGRRGTEFADGTMWADTINEIDPKGNLVWQWRAIEHMDFDTDIIGPIHTREEWSHQNTLWVCEDGDIMSSSRHIDMAFKISKKTGEITWRWGNVAYLDKESGTVERKDAPECLGGPHDVHIIPSGLPGAGNMLCYDNGMYAYISRAVEVDMKTKEIVWSSVSDDQPICVSGRVPFSLFISGARRLPNGNTLLCEGANGRLYEVTREKEVVWEYWRPEKDKHNGVMDGVTPWAIFRCFRYAPDFCPQFAKLPKAEGEPIM